MFYFIVILQRTTVVYVEIPMFHLVIMLDINYESVSKSFRTGHLERDLQMLQLSATRCSCIAILWVILVSLPPQPFVLLLNECLLLFMLLSTQSGNFWIHPRIFHSHWVIIYRRAHLSPKLASPTLFQLNCLCDVCTETYSC